MAKARILFVEDSRSQAAATSDFLERAGYDVVWAENGTSAIKVAKTEPIDVIILDLELPDLNGNEVCRWLKVNEDTRGIPIIMLTAKAGVQNKVAGLEAGADDYLSKPYMDSELSARIYASLRTKALQDELRRKNQQLQDLLSKVEVLAVTDPLTSLFNRRYFENMLVKEVERARRYEAPFSCMMIDLDHFKRINDAFGHVAGDSVLVETSSILRSSLRGVDTVARWGGEEFVILLPESSKEASLIPANRILESVAAHSFRLAPGTVITVSIGMADSSGISADELGDRVLSDADTALYLAKRNGRNRIELYQAGPAGSAPSSGGK
ncbi:MAG: diguanylate cyclase [Nitrospiraceae bacterium]|nr:diguanylate cyclase [Nitrospiraceae bacterium]